MQIKIVDKNKKETSLKLDDEQVLFLLEFAVVELMKRGVMALSDEEGADGEYTLQ